MCVLAGGGGSAANGSSCLLLWKIAPGEWKLLRPRDDTSPSLWQLMGRDRLAQGYQKASLFALVWDWLWGAMPASETPVESGCGWSLSETSSFLISPCPLLSPSLPFLPRALPQLTTCTKSLPQDLLPGILRLLTLDMGSHSTYASSPSFAHLPTKWAYVPRSILVGFGGGVNEKRHVKSLVIHALRMTCSFSLPLREVSGCTQGCTSWKEWLKSGEPQLHRD